MSEKPASFSAVSENKEKVLILSEAYLFALLENLWRLMLFLSLLAGMGCIVRYVNDSWRPIYHLHLALILVVWLLFSLRSAFTFQWRVRLILISYYGTAIAGIMAMGMLSPATLFLAICPFLAQIFYTPKTGLLHCAFAFLLLAGFGYAYSTGLMRVPIDANDYIHDGKAWAMAVVGVFFVFMSIFLAIHQYQRALISLLREISRGDTLPEAFPAAED